MYNTKVVIINAYEPRDFFADALKAYDNTIAQAGTSSSLLFISNMYFSQTAFPERYTLDTLESDLQKSVALIQTAQVLSFFVSIGQRVNPAFESFIKRLFHLTHGRINENIWGRTAAYNKKVRIITIINDEAIWKQFKQNKKNIYHPINTIDFRFFGFGQIYTTTFGPLKESVINAYAEKCIKTMHVLAKKDT